jgi:hypothetical protein
MANWNLPTITSDYIGFVTEMNDKFIDAATLQNGAPTNLPDKTIRYNRSIDIFEEWDLVTWNPKVIGVAGGGTGSTTAAGARTNLGLGSMATQNNNAVNITGGSITGINFDAGSITSGIVALARGGTGASLALGISGQVMMSIVGQVNFADGDNISKLNASNLIVGTVPLARLSGVGLLASNQTWAGVNTFTSQITISGGEADVYLISTLGGVNQKRMRIAFYLGNLYFIRQSDDGSSDIATPFYIGSDNILNAGNSQGLQNLNAGNLGLGTVPLGRLGAGGAPNTSTFLRGDNTWQVPPTTGGFTSGMIIMFDTGCPAGWTRVSAADNRYLIGSGAWGVLGGRGFHGHNFEVWSDNGGDHTHPVDITRRSGGVTEYGTANYQPGSSPVYGDHKHDTRINGDTGAGGTHNHRVAGSTGTEAIDPYSFSVVLCRKD